MIDFLIASFALKWYAFAVRTIRTGADHFLLGDVGNTDKWLLI